MFSLTFGSLRSLAGAFGSLASHDNQLISNFINFNFFFIKHHSMYVEVCSCIRAQSISEYQLLGISRWFFSLIRQIEIDQGVKRIEIGQIQLCSRVIIIFPHCISHDILENPHFAFTVILCFRVENSISIFQSTVQQG